MAQGRRPDIDGFADLVGWLGLPADSFMGDGAAPDADEANRRPSS